MTDNKSTLRSHSQDRPNSISRKMNLTTETFHSSRNCPEILSVFALTHRRMEDRQKEIYRSITSDAHHYHTINYPIQSPSASPIPNLEIENDNKQPMFPKLTPRSNSTSKKFPTSSQRNISLNIDNKRSMPTKKPSSLQTKMPIVSTEKKKKNPRH